MKAKHILLGISAAALAGLIGYNACMANGNKAVLITPKAVPEETQQIVENPKITRDNETLTIEYSYEEEDFGTNKYVFQQFGKECEMRYLEIQECPNARRNDGTLYGCKGMAFRDFGCDGIVDELYSVKIGGPTMTLTRDLMAAYSGIIQLVDSSYAESRKEMESKTGISLEDEVSRWNNLIQ